MGNDKLKILWENNPDTPITASSLSQVSTSSSEYGGIIYKDIPELLEHGNYSDNLIKLRANSKVLLRSYTTKALLFNIDDSLTSHNSNFGPVVQDNIIYDSTLLGKQAIYIGDRTDNLLEVNSGFEDGFDENNPGTPLGWNISLTENLSGIPSVYNPGDAIPTWGDNIAVDIVERNGPEDKCLVLYNGAYGKVELVRIEDLSGCAVLSISFDYKSNADIDYYLKIGTGGSSKYWINNAWRQNSVELEQILPNTNGQWKRFEIRNILLSSDDRLLAVETRLYFSVNALHGRYREIYLDNFQFENHGFCSPFTPDSREISDLQYSHEILDLNKGLIDIVFYPKAQQNFSLITLETLEGYTYNAFELVYMYNDNLGIVDRFELRIYNTETNEFIKVNQAAGLVNYINNNTPVRVICGWDKDYGIKIVSSSNPDVISQRLETYIPVAKEILNGLVIAADHHASFANALIDTLKINTELKENVDILEDLTHSIEIDKTNYKILYVGHEAIPIIKTYKNNKDYLIYVRDNQDEDSASIIVQEEIIEDKYTELIGGFRTDDEAHPIISSIWDVTTKEKKVIHTERFTIKGTNSDDYFFDIRTTPLSEANDVRSTIPINFTDNLYGRYQDDIYNTQIQHFEVNKTGWVGIDNILIDENKITTRDYTRQGGIPGNGSMTRYNDLEITVSGTVNGVDSHEPKIFMHANQVVIQSGEQDIKLDSVYIDNNYIYTPNGTDLHINVLAGYNNTNLTNNIFLEAKNIFADSRNDATFIAQHNFDAAAGRDYHIEAGNDCTIETINGRINLDKYHINNNTFYIDTADQMEIFTTHPTSDIHIQSKFRNVDIDSGTSGIILLDDLIIKGSKLYKASGDIDIETNGIINIGQKGTGADPYTTTVKIRSDNFIVESQAVSFLNVDANDFITFDSVKIRQSDIYTTDNKILNVTGDSILTLKSNNSNIKFMSNAGFTFSDKNEDINTILNIKAKTKLHTDTILRDTYFNRNTDINNTAFDSKLFFDNTNNTFRYQTRQTASYNVNNTNTIYTVIENLYPNNSHDEMIKISMNDVKIFKDLQLQENLQISGNLSIGGNLTVNGNSTTLNVGELKIEDNIITLNSGLTTGIPSSILKSGIEVKRGTRPNTSLVFDESSGKWRLSLGENPEVLYDVLYNGYNSQFSNLYSVSSNNEGVKIENKYIVGGIELLNEYPGPSNEETIGRGVMNIGIHMDQPSSFIKDKVVNAPGAWISINTSAKSSINGFRFMYDKNNSTAGEQKALLDFEGNLSVNRNIKASNFITAGMNTGEILYTTSNPNELAPSGSLEIKGNFYLNSDTRIIKRGGSQGLVIGDEYSIFVSFIPKGVDSKIANFGGPISVPINHAAAPSGFTNIFRGTGYFNGAGIPTVITHDLKAVPEAVSITPNFNPNGFLGEVWYTANTTSISVFNSGTAFGSTAKFSLIAMK